MTDRDMLDRAYRFAHSHEKDGERATADILRRMCARLEMLIKRDPAMRVEAEREADATGLHSVADLSGNHEAGAVGLDAPALIEPLHKLHDRLRTLAHDLAETGDLNHCATSERRQAEANACLQAARSITTLTSELAEWKSDSAKLEAEIATLLEEKTALRTQLAEARAQRDAVDRERNVYRNCFYALANEEQRKTTDEIAAKAGEVG